MTARLAAVLGVGRGQVSVVRGPGSRAKVIEVEGMDETEANRRIDEALKQRSARHGE